MEKIKLSVVVLLFFTGVFTAISVAITYVATRDPLSAITAVIAVTTGFFAGRLFVEFEKPVLSTVESVNRTVRELNALLSEHLRAHEVQPYDPESLGQVLRGIQERLSSVERVAHQIRGDLRPPVLPVQTSGQTSERPAAGPPKVVVRRKDG